MDRKYIIRLEKKSNNQYLWYTGDGFVITEYKKEGFRYSSKLLAIKMVNFLVRNNFPFSCKIIKE